ncbi:MAG: hypothetical protein CME62_04900 [Halobacteriovoraceae bacterium]|nr:hypothetical protein [Halobacteriovoraceae bacterium]|tara:strand:- start:930 stop:2243 length:1314 start_codon:yes stop_codon:yes gene_type:complete
MSLTTKVIKSIEDLKDHILTGSPSFYMSSRTSTVIPYEKIEEFFKEDITLVDLSHMPAHMEINNSGNLIVRGGVSWKDAREYLRDKGHNIMTSPTEELALILAGVATSCTGERCFCFGNLRSQIVSLKYLNHKGEEKTLTQKDLTYDFLEQYQNEFKHYADYKNAPYPRFEKEIDLMIGTEGQLGVITEVELKIVPDYPLKHFFMLVPKWEEDLSAHLEINKKIQKHREDVLLCELVDSNSFTYLPAEDRPNKGLDAIFFEIKESYFETFYEEFLLKLEHISEENIFEISETRFHNLRASIPRAVFEANSRMGVVKVGTDIQVQTTQFEDLMRAYQELTKAGVDYNLFGHFGDQHLHFNFMPTPEKVKECEEHFQKLYKKIAQLKGSPFAEHGIGILKQKYIQNFWSETQPEVFHKLKALHDPKAQFFPGGFMGLGR